MCGLVGIASRTPVRDRRWLASGIGSLRHRGPDARAESWSDDGRVGLGHARLAIHDLSPAGKQPMCDNVGNTIVFNGEIYNFADIRTRLIASGYSFQSDCDTEVLLKAYANWGEDCLRYLEGMFAFALHDVRTKTVFLARDRAGEKPLFYRHVDGELRFASELKGMLVDPALPRTVDRAALDQYLSDGFSTGNACLIAGFRKLEAGHCATFDLDSGGLRIEPYWKVQQSRSAGAATHPADLLEELERLLSRSVAHQLSADVPVGVLLSGGVDSSLITAMAARHHPRLRTYTASFPGEGRYDEASHAQLVAQHFGTEHTVLQLEAPRPELLEKLAWHFDEPIADDSILPTYLICEAVRRDCTVALGGDGADELFGGYSSYSRALQIEARLGRVPKSVRSAIARAAGRVIPIGFRGRAAVQMAGFDRRFSFPWCPGYFDAGWRKNMLKPHLREKRPCDDPPVSSLPQECDVADRARWHDFGHYLPDVILAKVDRASMAVSLEVRAPFLDHHIIEFAFSKIPGHLKSSISERKILLKRLAGPLMPAGFDLARKQGFSSPLGSWLSGRGQFGELVQDVLRRRDSMFATRAVDQLWKARHLGSNGKRLFALLMLELWRERHGIEAS
jgi:asparagine synthase (glutamine-hydrolysing)